MDLNRVTLIGRLTRDPELRTTPNGQSVCTASIATSYVWVDQTGAKQEKTEFHNCVFWRRLADIAGQYLTKGKQVYVEGRLQTRDWTDQTGVKRYKTEIIVENMIMLGSPSGAGQSRPAQPAAGTTSGQVYDAGFDSAKDDEIKVEDIPF